MSLPESPARLKLKRGVDVPAAALEQMERVAARQGSDFTRANPASLESSQLAPTQVDSVPVAPVQPEPAPVESSQAESVEVEPAQVRPSRVKSKAEPVRATRQGGAGGLRAHRIQVYLDAETFELVQARALELERSDSWVAGHLIAQGIRSSKK